MASMDRSGFLEKEHKWWPVSDFTATHPGALSNPSQKKKGYYGQITDVCADLNQDQDVDILYEKAH